MNRDMRDLTTSGAGTASLTAATVDLRTDYIDVATLVGPVTAIGVIADNSNLSGTLALEHATSAAGASSATVTEDSDFPGGRDAQGANATGGNDIAAGGGSAALSYNGSRQFVRAHLRINRGGGANINANCSVVLVGQPQIAPAR